MKNRTVTLAALSALALSLFAEGCRTYQPGTPRRTILGSSKSAPARTEPAKAKAGRTVVATAKPSEAPAA